MAFRPFSGNELTVESANLASSRDATVIGVVGQNCIVLGVEKKSASAAEQKIFKIHKNIALGYSGLKLDASFLIYEAVTQCESLSPVFAEKININYVANFILAMKHQYKSEHGYRPFGIKCLIAGFDENGAPVLFQTQPSGDCMNSNATAIGCHCYTVQEYLNSNYDKVKLDNVERTVKMALNALMQIGKNFFDISVIEKDTDVKHLGQEEIAHFINDIVAEQKDVEESE